MFVTDSVEAIVPDYLTLLHGVIDSPDIPLNVSRSYLQADSNVKMISGYITKKVADRLEEIFKKDRQAFEEKWDNVKLFIEYGMISDEKFCERALKFCLLKNTENKYFSIEDYRKGIEGNQTDKDKKLVILYATNAEDQYSYIEAAKNKGYDVLLLDCHLDSYFVNMLESKLENVKFARVDSDSIDRLIVKEEVKKPELKEEEKKALDEIFKGGLPEGMEWNVDADNLGADAAPVLITQSEFMRRYREMSKLGGGLNFYGSMPESYTLTVNLENPLVAELKRHDRLQTLHFWPMGCSRARHSRTSSPAATNCCKPQTLADPENLIENILFEDSRFNEFSGIFFIFAPLRGSGPQRCILVARTRSRLKRKQLFYN